MIESDERQAGSLVQARTQPRKVGPAAAVNGADFTVDDRRSRGEDPEGGDQAFEFSSPVMTVAGKKPDLRSCNHCLGSIAIVFTLVDPPNARWYSRRKRRELWGVERRRGAIRFRVGAFRRLNGM
jgi:hypothetical protein